MLEKGAKAREEPNTGKRGLAMRGDLMLGKGV